ncbi:hypothetical protein Plhal304r1_c048g0130481 [Plasmopara halstedii]
MVDRSELFGMHTNVDEDTVYTSRTQHTIFAYSPFGLATNEYNIDIQGQIEGKVGQARTASNTDRTQQTRADLGLS